MGDERSTFLKMHEIVLTSNEDANIQELTALIHKLRSLIKNQETEISVIKL